MFTCVAIIAGGSWLSVLEPKIPMLPSPSPVQALLASYWRYERMRIKLVVCLQLRGPKFEKSRLNDVHSSPLYGSWKYRSQTVIRMASNEVFGVSIGVYTGTCDRCSVLTSSISWRTVQASSSRAPHFILLCFLLGHCIV